jgi:hypothetical protein
LRELQERQKQIVTERTLPAAAQAEEALDGAIAVARQRTAQEEDNVEASLLPRSATQ